MDYTKEQLSEVLCKHAEYTASGCYEPKLCELA